MHIKSAPIQAICKVINPASINLEGLKWYVCSLITIELKINNLKKFEKCINMCKLNNILLSNQCVKGEITREITEYYEMNKNEDATYQNLLNEACLVRGKCIVINMCTLQRKISQ